MDIGIVFFLRRLVAGSTVFYTVCVLTTLFFLQIAIQFPEVSKEFLLMEQRMADYGYPNHVGLKVKVFLYTFLILATGECEIFVSFIRSDDFLRIYFIVSAEHGALISLNSLNAWHSASESGKGFFFLFYSIRFPPVSSEIFAGIQKASYKRVSGLIKIFNFFLISNCLK